ncbi:hypothetical protein GW17_00043234 [Ensete ventricosum]|nr:hypothetical protein GW17_00043234 [Ensete ventricosum]
MTQLKNARCAVSQLISSGLSSKILKEALNQQKEILQEAEEENFRPVLRRCRGSVEIDEEDDKVLAAFMSTKSGPQLTLADIIVLRIKEKEADVISGQSLPEILRELKNSWNHGEEDDPMAYIYPW